MATENDRKRRPVRVSGTKELFESFAQKFKLEAMSVIGDRIKKGEPATGSIKDLSEWLLESFQSWTPEQQAKFRAEVMADVHRGLAKIEWEKEFPNRPYKDEKIN